MSRPKELGLDIEKQIPLLRIKNLDPPCNWLILNDLANRVIFTIDFMKRKIRIIYANSDHDDFQYLRESEISAQSFRKYIPEAEIVLYTNNSDYSHPVYDKIMVREFVVPRALKERIHKRGQMLVKHQAMYESPAKYNLVLGCDTYCMHKDVNELFPLLERFDFAAAHAPNRIAKPIDGIPSSYPEFNCDVIAFRRNSRTRALIRRWKKMYESDAFEHPHDQGTFRYLTYTMRSIKVATLPFEYNDRRGIFGLMQATEQEKRKHHPIIVQNRDEVQKVLHSQDSKQG